MIKQKTNHFSFKEICEGLKNVVKASIEDKTRNITYHSRIEDPKFEYLEKNGVNKVKEIITDLKTQPNLRDAFKRHKITQIIKNKRDDYSYLQDKIDKDDIIYHCQIVGEQRLFFTIRNNENEIYILDACNRHKKN